MALSASAYEVWLPILSALIGGLIIWFTTKGDVKFKILTRIFIFFRDFIKLIEEKKANSDDGKITADEWEEIMNWAIAEIRLMVGEIQETFKAGDSAKLETAKDTVITNGAAVTWAETDKILVEKETTDSLKTKVTTSLRSLKK